MHPAEKRRWSGWSSGPTSIPDIQGTCFFLKACLGDSWSGACRLVKSCGGCGTPVIPHPQNRSIHLFQTLRAWALSPLPPSLCLQWDRRWNPTSPFLFGIVHAEEYLASPDSCTHEMVQMPKMTGELEAGWNKCPVRCHHPQAMTHRMAHRVPGPHEKTIVQPGLRKCLDSF